jgi:uncharacterized membrane protein YgcG
MTTKSKLMMFTAAAVMSGTVGFAQVVTDAPPMTQPPVTAPAPFDFSDLLALFSGPDAPNADAIADALPTGFTVERVRVRGDGSVRVEATTETGERVRVIVRDGEVRYRIKDASDSNGDNSDDTSDSNGDNSDDTSDSNGDNTSDGNGGSSGGGNGGGSGGGSSDD